MVIELGKVINKVDDVKESNAYPRRERAWATVTTAIVHRIKVPAGNKAEHIWEFFTDPKYKTGGKMPYHFIIEEDGTCIQCVGLETVAPGALKLNNCGVQIGVVGDFRKTKPYPAQIFALIGLCAKLKFAGVREIIGHTERAGTSTNPNKVCPGKYIDMDSLRSVVKQRLSEVSMQNLTKMGVTL